MSWWTRQRETSATELYAEALATIFPTRFFVNSLSSEEQREPGKFTATFDLNHTAVLSTTIACHSGTSEFGNVFLHRLDEGWARIESTLQQTIERGHFVPGAFRPNNLTSPGNADVLKPSDCATSFENRYSTNVDSDIVANIDVIDFLSQTVRVGVDVSARASESHKLSIATEVRQVPTWSIAVDRHSVLVAIAGPGPLSTVNFLEFQAVSTRFRFEDQKEYGSLFTSRKSLTPKQKIPRSPPLSPPPEASRQSLQEKLRLLLLPPIEDLLTDPQLCLPEAPFPYQMQGIGWLMQREHALLADEMGLGKTMQAIVAARLLWKQGKVKQILVVCPKTLFGNWKAELSKWWPQVSNYVSVCDGSRQGFLSNDSSNIIIKIINYESLARELDWLRQTSFSHDMVIIDEAQRIKNSDIPTSRAVKQLKSKYRWALTGTPLENGVDDLISVFGFVKEGLLTSQHANSIGSRISPYMLRRRTDDVLPDLPKRTDVDIEIELLPKQRRAYDQAEIEGIRTLNAQGDTATITHVFQLITSLRQICNFEVESGESAKLDRLCEDLEEIVANKRKTLVFSQFKNAMGLKSIERKLHDFHPLTLHGDVPGARRDAMKDEFTHSSNRRVMLLNYKVGGVGLNLQAAQYVYLFDRWWNPAVEDQALKRAHRLGQKEPVFVFRFVCKDTIEERIVKTLAKKRALFEAVIDGLSVAQKMGLTENEMLGLFPGLTIRSSSEKKAPSIPRLVMENLDPKQFEILVSKIYESQGYRVTLTGKSSDGGIDLIAEKTDQLVIVQCKRWKDGVGVPVVRELWGTVNGDQRIMRGDLVVSSTITSKAREFAADKRLRLIDGNELRALAKRHGVALFADQ